MTRTYRTIKQLRADPPACDMYISGSDQLWNAALTSNGFDSAYFLDFGGSDIRRATYSVGSDFSSVTEPDKLLSRLLSGLDAISLREGRNLGILKKAAGNKLVRQDIDPTLLLEAKDYEVFIGDAFGAEAPYIFTYTLENASQRSVFELAKRLSSKTGLPVIDGSGINLQFDPGGVNRLSVGPSEYLRLTRDASYVVTNSFHGTVFSVQHKKSFYTIPHPRTGYRVTELLETLGLSGRCGTDPDTGLQELLKTPDYEKAHRTLEALREDSMSYLRYLSGEKI